MLQQLLRRRDKEMRQDDATRNAVQYVCVQASEEGDSGFVWLLVGYLGRGLLHVPAAFLDCFAISFWNIFLRVLENACDDDDAMQSSRIVQNNSISCEKGLRSGSFRDLVGIMPEAGKKNKNSSTMHHAFSRPVP